MAHRVWQHCAEPDGLTWAQKEPISVDALTEIRYALLLGFFPGAVAVPEVDATAPMKKSWWETVKERVDEIRTALEFPACPWNHWDLEMPVSRKMLTELRMAVPDEVWTLEMSEAAFVADGGNNRLSVEKFSPSGDPVEYWWHSGRGVRHYTDSLGVYARRFGTFFETHDKGDASGYVALWVFVLANYTPVIDIGLPSGINESSGAPAVWAALPGSSLGGFTMGGSYTWNTVPLGVQTGLYNSSRFLLGFSSDTDTGYDSYVAKVQSGINPDRGVKMFLDRLPAP